MLLDYGSQTVIVEVKMIRQGVRDLESWVEAAAEQVASYVRAIGASRGAVVVFSPFRPTQAYSTVRLNAVTEIVAVVIYVGDSDQAADLAQM